jgi:hypothetical protein
MRFAISAYSLLALERASFSLGDIRDLSASCSKVGMSLSLLK